VDNNYKIEEAIFYQFEGQVWRSNSRKLVETKFNYAMGWMSYYVALGYVQVEKAEEIFHKDDFYKEGGLGMVTYQYDPLVGKKRLFRQDKYYFFTSSDSMNNCIKEMEVTMKEGRICFDLVPRKK
jgi:hypothetical protein